MISFLFLKMSELMKNARNKIPKSRSAPQSYAVFKDIKLRKATYRIWEDETREDWAFLLENFNIKVVAASFSVVSALVVQATNTCLYISLNLIRWWKHPYIEVSGDCKSQRVLATALHVILVLQGISYSVILQTLLNELCPCHECGCTTVRRCSVRKQKWNR